MSRTVAQSETLHVAKHMQELDAQLVGNEQHLADLVRVSESAPLLEETGIGAISGAKSLTV